MKPADTSEVLNAPDSDQYHADVFLPFSPSKTVSIVVVIRRDGRLRPLDLIGDREELEAL